MAKYRLTILNKDQKGIGNTKLDSQKFVKGGGWGSKKLVKLDALFSRESNILTTNELHVKCEVSYVASRNLISGSSDNFQPQSVVPSNSVGSWVADFKQLMENKTQSDIVICVDGTRFDSHKAVLGGI